ncbi:MAG: hypothetical protein JWO33_1882 [Caulobacteraceae bacterium]|nr:hypothetical protein [Caulobacteraceae bacterium]
MALLREEDGSPALVAVDRRTTLAWLATALAAGQLAACGDGAKGLTWPEVAAIKAKGIGGDPDLEHPVVPWPMTLTRTQLLTAAAAADLILPAEGGAPAPSQVGVPAFIDEWVSAPYPNQHKDRGLILPGLDWLDKQSQTRNGSPFARANPADQKLIFDDIAFKARVKPGLEKPAEFFKRLRALTLGAYFTTQEGWKDLGYLGNAPSNGPYPGPTPQAVAHMRKVVEGMGLKFTAP